MIYAQVEAEFPQYPFGVVNCKTFPYSNLDGSSVRATNSKVWAFTSTASRVVNLSPYSVHRNTVPLKCLEEYMCKFGSYDSSLSIILAKDLLTDCLTPAYSPCLVKLCLAFVLLEPSAITTSPIPIAENSTGLRPRASNRSY